MQNSNVSLSKINTYARIKPKTDTNTNKLTNNEILSISSSPPTVTINSKDKITYCFDRIFNSDNSQEEIFDALGLPMIKDIIQGMNTSLFCFGGSNSGKTFSLFGPMYTLHEGETKFHGVLPRFLNLIFDEQKMKEHFKFNQFSLDISYCGILIDNDEKIQSLLSTNNENLNYVKLENYEKAKYIINSYVKNIDQNKNYKNSSFFFLFKITTVYSSKNEDGKVYSYSSNVIFGDFAQQTSQPMINLENTINFYINNKTFLNFTNSKLIETIKNCFGGDSKCNVICHFTHELFHANEEILLGNFNNKIRAITNNVIQHENCMIDIQKLLKEKEELQQQLKAKSNPLPIDENIIKCIKEIYSNEMIKDFIHKKMRFDVFVNKITNKTKNLLTNSKNPVLENYVIERFLSEIPNIKVASKLNKEIVDTLAKLGNSEIVSKLSNILSNINNTTNGATPEKKENFDEIITNEKELFLENEHMLLSQIKNEKAKNLLLQNEIQKLKGESISKDNQGSEITDHVILSLLELKKETDEKIEQINGQNSEISQLKEKIASYEQKEKQLINEISNYKFQIESMKTSNEIIKAQFNNFDKISDFFKNLNFDDIYKNLEKVNSECDLLSKNYQSELDMIQNFYNHIVASYKQEKNSGKSEENSSNSNLIALPKYIFARAFVGEELRKTKNKKEKIEKDFNDLTRENVELKKEIYQYKEKIEELTKNQKNERESQKLKEEIEKLKQQINDMQKEKQVLFNEKNNYFMQINDIKKQNDQLLKEKNNQLEKIEKELFEANNTKVNLEKKMVEMEESKQYLITKLENAYIQKMKFQTEKEKMNKELSESNDKLNEYQEKINTLLQEKNDELAKKEGEIRKLMEDKIEITKLKEENEIKQIQVSHSLAQARKNLEKHKEEAEKELTKILQEKQLLEKEANEYKKKENELSNQVDMLKDDCEKIKLQKNKIEEEKYKYIQENVQLSNQMADIVNQLKKLQQEKEQAEKNYLDALKKLQIAEEQMKKLLLEKEKEITEISNNMNEIKKEKEEIAKLKKEAENECTSLNNNLNNLLNQVVLLEKEKKNTDQRNISKIDALSLKIKEINKLISSLKKEVEEKETNKKNLEKKYNELTEQNDILNKDKIKLIEELSKMKQKAKENEEKLTKQIKDYQIQSNNLNDVIEQLSIEKNELINNQKEIEQKANQLNEKLDKMNNQKKQIDMDKIYLQNMVSNLIEDVYSFKDNDIIGYKNQNKKYELKFKEIFGKKYDINTTNYKNINWNKSTLSILNQKIILLREEKKQLNQDLALIRSYIKGSISESLKNSQFCLLVQIKEQNRRLKQELEIIKLKNIELQNQLVDSFQVEEKKEEKVNSHTRNRTKCNTIQTKNNIYSSVGSIKNVSPNKKILKSHKNSICGSNSKQK